MKVSSVLTLVSALASAASALQIRGDNGVHTLKGAYLVQVPAGVDAQSHVVSSLTAAGVNAADITVRTTIATDNFNGVSFSLANPNEQTDEVVSNIGSAVNVFRVNARFAPEPTVSANGQAFPPEAIHALTGVNDVRSKLGLLGEGVKVAVIDTGVYYKHPALGGGFGPGYKVVGGYDLVGDNYGNANPIPVPDEDPIDNCSSSSHGTHVAGIVAADARNVTDAGFVPAVPFTGVAPGANILAYRVFGCPADGTFTDVMTAAIYRAAHDGADIINLSIGGGPTYSDESDSIAAEIVGQAGHYVFGSNGNDGAGGVFAGGAPANSIGGFGVAAFDNAAIPEPYLTVNGQQFPWSAGQTNSNFHFDTPYEIVVNDLTADDLDKQNDGSATTPTMNATGKALLIRWGDTAFGGSVKRCGYAMRAGAAACILYSNTASIPGIVGGTIPSLSTSHEAGRAIIAAIKAGQSVSFIVSQKEALFGLPTAGTVSDFSSPGLDQWLAIKPDFGGVGGHVYSTISAHAAGSGVAYADYSGTSMASPYAAGAAALYVQAKNKATSFSELKTSLQNTATPAKKFGTDMIDSVSYQGAGLVNLYKAITSKTIVTPSNLALNDTTHTAQHYTITINNKYSSDITYTLNSQGALMVTPFLANDDMTQPANSAQYTADYATVTFSKGNTQVSSLDVTVKAGSSKNVNIHFTAPSNAIAGLFPIYSGYITVTAQGDAEPAATVPYAGIVGDWNSAPVWSRNSVAIRNTFLKSFTRPSANATGSTGLYDSDFAFTPLSAGNSLNATNGAVVLPVFSTTSKYAQVDVVFAGSDNSVLPANIRHKTPLGYVLAADINLSTGNLGSFSPLTWSPAQRNAPAKVQSLQTPTVFLWAGQIVTNATNPEAAVQLPAGQYQMRFSALKHFGRRSATPGGSDYDVVTSAVFNLVY